MLVDPPNSQRDYATDEDGGSSSLRYPNDSSIAPTPKKLTVAKPTIGHDPHWFESSSGLANIPKD